MYHRVLCRGRRSRNRKLWGGQGKRAHRCTRGMKVVRFDATWQWQCMRARVRGRAGGRAGGRGSGIAKVNNLTLGCAGSDEAVSKRGVHALQEADLRKRAASKVAVVARIPRRVLGCVGHDDVDLRRRGQAAPVEDLAHPAVAQLLRGARRSHHVAVVAPASAATRTVVLHRLVARIWIAGDAAADVFSPREAAEVVDRLVAESKVEVEATRVRAVGAEGRGRWWKARRRRLRGLR